VRRLGKEKGNFCSVGNNSFVLGGDWKKEGGCKSWGEWIT